MSFKFTVNTVLTRKSRDVIRSLVRKQPDFYEFHMGLLESRAIPKWVMLAYALEKGGWIKALVWWIIKTKGEVPFDEERIRRTFGSGKSNSATWRDHSTKGGSGEGSHREVS